MKEKLQEYALFAEIIGGVAIVASLLFVGFQIQQSTAVTKADSYVNFVNEVNEWRALMLSEPELRRLFVSFSRDDINTLEEDELTSLALLMGNFFSVTESAYYSREYGLLGESEWERAQKGICEMFNGAKRNDMRVTYISEQFRNYMEDNC